MKLIKLPFSQIRRQLSSCIITVILMITYKLHINEVTFFYKYIIIHCCLFSVCCPNSPSPRWTPCPRCSASSGTITRTTSWRCWTTFTKRRHFVMSHWHAITLLLNATKWFSRLAHHISKPCSWRIRANIPLYSWKILKLVKSELFWITCIRERSM